jgi:ABC transport system ATP-binding/permease protein
MPSWLIGSNSECDLVVTGPGVSGRHCLLKQTDDGCFLEDLGTAAGTFVNDVRVDGRVPVNRSDSITLGKSVPMPWPPEPGLDLQPKPAQVITIGREPDNDVVIETGVVSGWHARIVVENGQARIEDLGSSNGTFVNSRERRIDTAPLAETDIVFLGSYRIAATRLLKPEVDAAADGSFVIKFRGSSMVLGRGLDCDRVLDFPMVSRRHARLTRSGEQFRIEDLGSSNGTYVNGERLRESRVVRPGDRIGLGSYTFTLTLSGDLEVRDGRNNLRVEARDVAVAAGGRPLIEGISLAVLPGELVALMGPSGAGKSTLLKALGGYIRPSRGAVLLNGVDLARHYADFRGQIGFVPQDDIIHRDLTVGEALRFAARLRLPADYGDAEIRRRVRDVLAQLDLAGTADVLIGSPSGSGTSGGQRRRVNLAMELLTDPPVLLLDEPTSGLSSEDAVLVMQVLRKLADRGKTILLSIHQPGHDSFRILDRVMVVARDAGSTEPGKLAYDGPAYPDAILFFNPPQPAGGRPIAASDPSPDDLLKGLARRPVREWVERLADQGGRQAERVARSAGAATATPPSPVPQDLRRSPIAQWWALVSRSVAIKRKDRWNTAILLAQAPVIALLIVLVFGKQAGAGVDEVHWAETTSGVVSTTFILGLAALWFGCSNSVREIVAEWRVYQRERMVNLKLGPYIASKLTALGTLCLFQCTVLLAIVHYGIGLKGDWPATFGILYLASGVGLALGLVISAVARTSEVAVALLPLVILPLLIFGGALQPIHRMHPSLRFACESFPSRWAFEGLVLLEAEKRPLAPEAAGSEALQPGVALASAPRDMAEAYFPVESDRMGPRASVIALAGTLVFLVALIAVILRSRDLF